MRTSDLNAPRPPAAEIYRRLERRQRRPPRLMAILLVAISVVVSLAVVTLEKTSRPALAPNTPMAAIPNAAPAASPGVPDTTTSAERHHHPASARQALVP